MIYLANEDYYEVYLKSMISDYDRDTLILLYQPIIGAGAISLYLSLYGEFKKNKSSMGVLTHKDLIETTGYNIGEIATYRKSLEAIGLLKTYYKKEKDNVYYKYLIFAPKTPKEFFDDVLFKGLLISKIGERKVQKLIREYKQVEIDLTDFNEISEPFNNVFNPDLNSDVFKNALDIKGGYARETINISKGFDNSLFLKTLKENYLILEKAVKKKDMKQIAELSLLYGVSEIMMADYFSQSYDPETNKLDLEKLKSLSIDEKTYRAIRKNDNSYIPFDTGTKLGKKIELMSSTSALDYLKIKQKNGAVSPSDIKLISELNEKYGLSSPVINALIDYCLERNSSLNSFYVTKIAASLVREGVTTTLDTMNYLKKFNRRPTKKEKVENESDNKVIDENEVDLDSLLEGL